MKTESITSFADLSTPMGERTQVLGPDHTRQLMAQAHLARGQALATVLRPVLGATFGRLWQVLKAAQIKRRNVSALNSLDDRMLRDMGIDRGQILGLVNSGVTGYHPRRALAEISSPANLSDESRVA